jgi:hypothetical protein
VALTHANTEIILRATYTILYTEVTFDTSYLTGGEAITPASVGLREIAFIIPGSSEGFEVEAIKSSPSAWLLQAFASSASTNTATEFASALDRSGLTVDLLIIGR